MWNYINNQLYLWLYYLTYSLIIFIPLLLGIAFFTVVERKVMGNMQRRIGPNVVGPLGILQPIADGLKLLFKEFLVPTKSNLILFLLSPSLFFLMSLIIWAVIPLSETGTALSDLPIAILYLLAIGSLGVYGILCSGWSSNSNYSFLGSLRSSAQMISYEVSIGLVLLTIIITGGSLNLEDIVLAQTQLWNLLPLFPLFFIFFVSGLAETNRIPFDLPEAEAELVSGYNVEYSSLGFALFFIAEYGSIIVFSVLCSIFFLGGWIGPFLPPYIWITIKVTLISIGFIWARTAFPRYRYDQLMSLGWKSLLPLSLGLLILISSIIIAFEWKI